MPGTILPGDHPVRQTPSNGLEVTNDVFESEANIASSRQKICLHTIKALLVATLGD